MCFFFFFKQKTAYEMRISDWSSDVCSSDLLISGGALTEESFDKVSQLFNQARGRDAMNKVLILEAAADDSVGNADQAPPVPKKIGRASCRERVCQYV